MPNSHLGRRLTAGALDCAVGRLVLPEPAAARISAAPSALINGKLVKSAMAIAHTAIKAE
ncbi:MAG: hypothetical protein IT507_04950 [Burkholderiaceae bacterium]|nr:hypothetical protein [Burkholderiaceae bacterium]